MADAPTTAKPDRPAARDRLWLTAEGAWFEPAWAPGHVIRVATFTGPERTMNAALQWLVEQELPEREG
jgi:hypothetical protein